MTNLLIGIDIGTTNWKVVACDPAGSIRAAYSTPAHSISGPDDLACWDPEALWAAVCQGIKYVTARAEGTARAVAVASTGEAGLLLDEEGIPVCPIIPWHDRCTETIGQRWESDAAHIAAITGFPPQHIATAYKLVWIKERWSESYTRARRWLCLADYIAYRLSGEQVMDFTLACRTMLFDLRKRDWSAELLDLVGVERALLPPTAPSGTGIGTVRNELVAELGFSPGATVATGGHDHLCGALAVGVMEPGATLDSIGTAELLLVAHPSLPDRSPDSNHSGLTTGIFVDDALHYSAGAVQSAGGVVDWACSALGYAGANASVTGYAHLSAEAAAATAAEDGLFFIPLLRGCAVPPRAEPRAEWIGLQERHGRGALARAVLEGLCFEARRVLESITALTGNRPERIITIGGGTRNPAWMQIRADTFNSTLLVPRIDEAVACGAAVLAGIGASVYPSRQAAGTSIRSEMEEIRPRRSLEEAYWTYRSILRDRCGPLFRLT